MTFTALGTRMLWSAVVIPLMVAALAAAAVACGGDDDGGGGGSSEGDTEGELMRLADLTETDALGVGGGKFRDTGFAVYCRQNVSYEDSVFEQIGFNPVGSQAKDEFCYNVSDDRTIVGLSRRSSSSGTGGCLVLTAAGGSVTRSEVRVLGQSGGCTP